MKQKHEVFSTVCNSLAYCKCHNSEYSCYFILFCIKYTRAAYISLRIYITFIYMHTHIYIILCACVLELSPRERQTLSECKRDHLEQRCGWQLSISLVWRQYSVSVPRELVSVPSLDHRLPLCLLIKVSVDKMKLKLETISRSKCLGYFSPLMHKEPFITTFIYKYAQIITNIILCTVI